MTSLPTVDPAPAPGRRRSLPAPGWLEATLTLLAVYGLGIASVSFAPADSKVAVWWPAAGVSVVLLVMAPRHWRWRLALGVVLSSALANYTAGRPPVAALGFGLSNAAEASVVAYWLTRKVTGRPSLRTQEDLWRLLVGALLGVLVVGTGVGFTVHFLLTGDFIVSATAVMASHGAAVLVITPLALVADASPHAARTREAVVQWIVALATAAYVFSPKQELGLAFLPMPILVWAAMRLGIRAVSAQLLTVGVLASMMSTRGWGPFAAGGVGDLPGTTGSLVQAFLIASALVALPLAVAVEQRGVALRRVSASEELFRKSFTESLVGMVLLRKSPEGLRVAEVNGTAAELLGGTADELEGRSWQELLTTKAPVDDVVEQMLRGETTGWRDELALTVHGRRRVGVALAPLSAQGPEPMFTAQMIDVTQAHEAGQRLRTEMDFTSAVLDTAGCLILVVTMDGSVVGLNPAAQRATGWPEAEIVGRPLWDALIPLSDQARVRAMFTEPKGIPEAHEGALLTRGGDRRHVVWSSAYLRDEKGAPTHVVMTGIDVTEERTARRLVSHVLESATATTIIGTDLYGTITVFNSGAEQMLGYAAPDMIGRAEMDLLHDRTEMAERARELGVEPGFRVFVAHLDDQDEPETRDWTYVRKDGSRFTVSLTISAVKDTFGKHIGYLGVGRDVTEQRRSEQVLVDTLEKERQAIDRLQELDRAKNDFVSTVSHELRTPITSIVGYTEMLQDGLAGEVSPEQDRLIDAVRRNGERLISLIEDLLTLSRIEAGTFAMERGDVDLSAVLHHAQEALHPLVEGRLLDVVFDVPDHAVSVHGDAGQLERVVLNLMSNGVKFTEDGGLVRCTLRGESSLALVEVVDTGIGIPVDEQAEIFDRFFRSSNVQERAIQGTGLGLSIVQSIVRSHGGDISVTSEPGRGTTFRVMLPVTDRAEVTSGSAR